MATAFSVGRQLSHIIVPGMSMRLLMMRKAGPLAVRRTRANGHPQAVWPSSFERAKWTHAVTVFIMKMRWSVRAKPVARATTSCACVSTSFRSSQENLPVHEDAAVAHLLELPRMWLVQPSIVEVSSNGVQLLPLLMLSCAMCMHAYAHRSLHCAVS